MLHVKRVDPLDIVASNAVHFDIDVDEPNLYFPVPVAGAQYQSCEVRAARRRRRRRLRRGARPASCFNAISASRAIGACTGT